ncbi:hypothetical protein T459_08688 [Capsicum annuum]|uniref:Uncharacterized protein n=1 Tax=Capsicum annuum TaxID=4072 RepID=A0A2G2ZX59_CAPAN|nr:hypothetical protein FXO37_17998 [Capsicum annuum]PHT86582.1 hypothetical protein T459_08688 [Capsicum annuum]
MEKAASLTPEKFSPLYLGHIYGLSSQARGLSKARSNIEYISFQSGICSQLYLDLNQTLCLPYQETCLFSIGPSIDSDDLVKRIYERRFSNWVTTNAEPMSLVEQGTKSKGRIKLETNGRVVLMGDGLLIQERSSIKETGRIAQIPVSEDVTGLAFVQPPSIFPIF